MLIARGVRRCMMIVEVEASEGPPLELVRGPMQFNHEPLETRRAPQASEHTKPF